jgi:hypothetical protein
VRLIVVGTAQQRQTGALGCELNKIREAGPLSKALLVLPPVPALTVWAR